MKTLIVAIIDESGSMGDKRNDVIGGWNTFLEAQKAVKDDEGVLILAKFNTVVSVVQDGTPIADVPPFALTGVGPSAYVPAGGTALFDAIAHSIRLADKLTFDRSVVVIITDGEENSSRETTLAQVKDIIQSRTKLGNWTFTYLGEQPEKWAAQTGTMVQNTGVYNPKTPMQNFVRAAESTAQYRASGQAQSSAFYGGDQQPAADPQAGVKQGPADLTSQNKA